MPIYNYKAKNQKGRTKRGQIVGMTESDALNRLNRLDLSE